LSINVCATTGLTTPDCHARLLDAIVDGDAVAARAALQRDIGTTATYIQTRQVLAPDQTTQET